MEKIEIVEIVALIILCTGIMVYIGPVLVKIGIHFLNNTLIFLKIKNYKKMKIRKKFSFDGFLYKNPPEGLLSPTARIIKKHHKIRKNKSFLLSDACQKEIKELDFATNNKFKIKTSI